MQAELEAGKAQPGASNGVVKAVRLSANISPEVFEALKRIAEKRGVTVTEALRRAISTEAFVEDELARGSTFLVEDPAGSQRELVFR